MTDKRVRADELLVARGLASTRSRARALILAGHVRSGGHRVDKAGDMLAPDAGLDVVQAARFASRGGEKLEHALSTFAVDVYGKHCADFGASTGGFTDVLLQRGAAKVYAIDVGYGQLDYRLRIDHRVVVLDRTNVRYLEQLPEPIDLVTIDVSFISLQLVLPAARRVLRPSGRCVTLIKPQFEAGKGRVGKGGVVRDPHVHRDVIRDVLESAIEIGFTARALTESLIKGPAGNVEFLALLDLDSCVGPDVSELIRAIVPVERTRSDVE